MPTYKFTVQQRFTCAYTVEANDEDEAWDRLLDGEGDCVEQYPGVIDSSRFEARVEEDTSGT